MRYFLIGLLLFLSGQEILADKSCPDGLVGKCCEKKCPSWWSKGWAATLYSGPLTSQTSSKIFQDADFGDSGIVALAVSKELGDYLEKRLVFELEAQTVQHFGDQKHFEFNPIVIVARWTKFPWNDTLPTTLAIDRKSVV